MISVEFKGIDELKKKIISQPKKTYDGIQIYLVRAQNVIQGIYTKNPWRVGGSGGGVPVKTGNLLKKGTGLKIETFRRIFTVDDKKVDYADDVYSGRGSMKARPWLEHAKTTGDKDIEKLQVELLNNISKEITR